jgi:hypothetical protein
LSLAIMVVAAACQDAVAPRDQLRGTGSVPHMLGDAVGNPTKPYDMHILQQAVGAPALQSYQVSFWARKDRAASVVVNYANGDPFLRFDIPRNGLQSVPDDQTDGPDNRRGPGGPDSHLLLSPSDSVLITVTIDPVAFSVGLEPSGLTFSKKTPAMLAVWYEHADPDLNGDGVVDSADQTEAEQLSIWVRHAKPAPWMKMWSAEGAGQPSVWTALRHFSEYAVSW